MKKNNPTLEMRFNTFLASFGEENLDDSIMANRLLGDGKRADYLLDGRKIVLELKTVKTDPEHKVDKHLLPLQDRPDYPHFYWPTEVTDILSYLSDGKKIAEKIGDALTKNIRGYISSADDQIRETKLALNIPLACGVLVILNQDVGILDPNLILSQVTRMLNKRKHNGNLRYEEIAYVWILSEAHRIILTSTLEATPSVLCEGPLSTNFPKVKEYLLELDRSFAKFEGIPYITNKSSDRPSYHRRSEKKQPEEPTQNHEIWRRDYRENPYLRTLSEEEFIEHTVAVLTKLAPNFLKGREKLPFDQVTGYGILFTHCLEEAEHRRLDFRKIQKLLPDFNKL